MAELLTNKNKLTILLLISIAIALLSMWQRETGTDDAWFAEEAYWLVKDGHVRSEMFYGMNNHQTRHLAYHRLHVWQGALVYKLFGWSTYIFKAILLVYFLFFMYMSHVYLKRYDILKDEVQYRFYFFLILAYALIVKLSFNYRPDITIMTLGFGSFFMLHSALKSGERGKAILSGLLAGACVLTHLNGVVFVFAGGMLLLLTKNFRLLVYFSVAAFVVSMLYFVEFRSLDMLRVYYFQLRSSPALSEKDFSLWGSILKFLSSYRSYFHKGSDASYSLLLMFVFWTQRRFIFEDENLRIIFYYFILVAISLALVSPGAKSLYLVYHAPYAFLLIAALYERIFTQSRARQWAFSILFSLFILTQWGETFLLYQKRTPALAETHHQVSQSMGLKGGERIVAPLTFVFDEIDNYTIQTVYPYLVRASQGQIRLEDFFTLAGEDKRSHLILTALDMHDLKLPVPENGQRFGNYVYVGMHGPYYGFKFAE